MGARPRWLDYHMDVKWLHLARARARALTFECVANGLVRRLDIGSTGARAFGIPRKLISSGTRACALTKVRARSIDWVRARLRGDRSSDHDNSWPEITHEPCERARALIVDKSISSQLINVYTRSHQSSAKEWPFNLRAAKPLVEWLVIVHARGGG